MRDSLRFWLRHRMQAAWMIAVLAVAVAVSTATWSITYGLWIQRPPFADPDTLISLGWTAPSYTSRASRISAEEYVDVRDAATAFVDLAGVESVSSWYLMTPDRLTTVATAYSTTNLFDLLGVVPTLGRLFEPADTAAVAGVPRAIVTDRLWRNELQADPSIVGRLLSVRADREPRTIEIVGVVPAEASVHRTAGTVDLFVAMPDGRRPGGSESRRIYDRSVIGRLHPGVSATEAQQRLTPILRQIDREHPLFERVRRADVLSLQAMWFGTTRPLLWLLGAAAGLVMLVAAANAAGLMSVIASRRTREFGVRAALGASSGRLLRQSIAEMAMIAGLSWVAAGALAVGLTRAFAWMAPRDIPRVADLHVDWRGWLIAAVLAAALCLALGLMPTWLRRSRDLVAAFRDGGLSFTPPLRTLLVRRAVVAIQMAVVLALLAATGLVSSTLWRLLAQPLGFDPAGVVIAQATPTERYFLDPPRYQQAMDDIRREVSTAPGRREVALALNPPLADWMSRGQVRFLDRPPEFIASKLVTDGFFAAMRTPILAGRDFRKSDFTGPPVVLVNEQFATEYFGGVEQAVGREFDYGPRHRIVGVVANVREGGLAEPLVPVVYPLLVARLRTPGVFHVISREANPASGAARLIEDAVRRADPTIHVEASVLTDRLREQTATARTQSAVLAVLAFVTLGLALLGIHATVSQMVEDRRHEMAIRSALGASPRGLVTLVVRGVTVPVVLGVGVGGLLSWIVARVTRQFLFDMSPFDPLVWACAAAFLVATAGLAAWLPARRAGLANPVLALKEH